MSGTNCAIVLAGAAFLLNLLPIRRSIRLALSFGVIFGYLGLVGPEPSVLRASVMVGAVLVGFILGRRVPPLEALSLAVVTLLIYQPALAMDFGFALSALATLGLLVLAPKLVEVLARRMPLWLAVVVSVSLAAQCYCRAAGSSSYGYRFDCLLSVTCVAYGCLLVVLDCISFYSLHPFCCCQLCECSVGKH